MFHVIWRSDVSVIAAVIQPHKPQQPRPCPICKVAMQGSKEQSSIIYRCHRCGTVVTIEAK
jgi:ribosomal protein L37AE/L43A